jgi:hypothetical protein
VGGKIYEACLSPILQEGFDMKKMKAVDVALVVDSFALKHQKDILEHPPAIQVAIGIGIAVMGVQNMGACLPSCTKGVFGHLHEYVDNFKNVFGEGTPLEEFIKGYEPKGRHH